MKKIIFILIISLLFTACSEKSKLMRKTDRNIVQKEYAGAVENIIKAIEIDKEDEEILEKLKPTIEEGREYYKNSIIVYKNDEDIKKYDRILESYKKLNQINNYLLNLDLELRKRYMLNIEDYQENIDIIKEIAAKEYYNIALKKYDNAKTKLEYRSAAKLFLRVNEYIEGYENTTYMYKTAKEKAIMNIVILPIKDYKHYSEYMYLGDMIYDRALEWLLFDREVKEFTNIITDFNVLNEEDYKKIEKGDVSILSDLKNREIDLVVYTRINAVFYEPPMLFTKVTHLKRTALVNTKEWNEERQDYDIVPKERFVYATKYEYDKKSAVKIVMSTKMIDPVRNRIMDVDTFSQRISDTVSWESYTGDERAYETYIQDELYNRTKEDMLFECANKIAEKYRKKISYFLK